MEKPIYYRQPDRYFERTTPGESQLLTLARFSLDIFGASVDIVSRLDLQ